MTNSTFTNRYFLGVLTVYMVSSLIPVYAQDFENSIRTKSGEIIGVGPDTDWSADYPTAATGTFYFQPQEGHQLAHVVIIEGTSETHCYAKKITYSLETENFFLEENAKIERNGDVLEGPVSITYESLMNQMILQGNPDNPATLLYNDPQSGDKLRTKALRIILLFEMVNGERILKHLEVIKNQSSQLLQTGSKSKPSLKRKISPPR